MEVLRDPRGLVEVRPRRDPPPEAADQCETPGCGTDLKIAIFCTAKCVLLLLSEPSRECLDAQQARGDGRRRSAASRRARRRGSARLQAARSTATARARSRRTWPCVRCVTLRDLDEVLSSSAPTGMAVMKVMPMSITSLVRARAQTRKRDESCEKDGREPRGERGRACAGTGGREVGERPRLLAGSGSHRRDATGRWLRVAILSAHRPPNRGLQREPQQAPDATRT